MFAAFLVGSRRHGIKGLPWLLSVAMFGVTSPVLAQDSAAGVSPQFEAGAPVGNSSPPTTDSAPGAPASEKSTTAAPSTRMYDPPSATSPSGPTYGQRRTLYLDEPKSKPDPKAYTLSATGGTVWYDAAELAGTSGIVEQLGPWTPNFRLQLGRQWFDQLQLQLDFSYLSETIKQEGIESGETSGTTMDVAVLSLSTGIAYRFDYVSEQPLVPYLAVGLVGSAIPLVSQAELDAYAGEASTDESTDDGETTDEALDEEVLGHRVGVYLGGGLEILLDTFSPARAADLELSSGINDTYVVIDARYGWQHRYFDAGDLKSDAALALDGWQVTAGLKFDF